VKGGESTQQATQIIQALQQESGYEYITTTLDDLIETISRELRSGEEELQGRIVTDLAEDQKINEYNSCPTDDNSGFPEKGSCLRWVYLNT